MYSPIVLRSSEGSRWPVPYYKRVTIAENSCEGRCGECRQLKQIRFYSIVRNVAKGPDHGGWIDANTTMACDDCIAQDVYEAADDRTLLIDKRKHGETQEAPWFTGGSIT